MSRPSQVWRSELPRFLKEGVGGAAEALAELDGTYKEPLTVERLLFYDDNKSEPRRYYEGKTLSERTVRYQLRALEALKVLVVKTPGATGRGDKREYWFNVAALAHLDLSVPELRPPHRRKGATEGGNRRGQQKGATDAETHVLEGGNKGGNRRGQQEFDPYCTDLLSTQAPALRAGTLTSDEKSDGENALEFDAAGEGESPAILPPWEVFNRARQSQTRNPDLPADGRDHPDAAAVGLAGHGRDHRQAPGSGLHLQQGSDLPGHGCADRSGQSVGPTQPTLGPMDVSAPEPERIDFAQLRQRLKAPMEKTRRRRFG
jgi:hypothetical protein